MKKTMIVFLILAASAAGVSFADYNNNPGNAMDNSDSTTNSSNNY